MKTRITDNMSYKFVALGVAVILWMSMLGRRDTTVTKEFELRVLLSPNVEMTSTPPPIVKVEVSGPRVAIKKFNQMNPLFTVDLTDALPGRQNVQLSRDGLSLPIGARILSLEPSQFNLQLRQTKAGAMKEN